MKPSGIDPGTFSRCAISQPEAIKKGHVMCYAWATYFLRPKTTCRPPHGASGLNLHQYFQSAKLRRSSLSSTRYGVTAAFVLIPLVMPTLDTRRSNLNTVLSVRPADCRAAGGSRGMSGVLVVGVRRLSRPGQSPTAISK